MKTKIVATTPEHIHQLSFTMRKCDREEIMASDGLSSYRALRRGYLGGKCFSLMKDDEVIAIFGHGAKMGIAVPWLLGSDKIEENKREFWTHSVAYINSLKEIYSYLINFVHVNNKTSIAWLKRLGFTIHKPKPYGKAQELFHKFDWRKG